MNIPYTGSGYHPAAAAALVERAAKERAAKEQEAARAREAALHQQRIVVEEAARVEAKARALPDALFNADPEIQALRAASEAAERRVNSALGVHFATLHATIAELKESVKASAIAVKVAAFEDAVAGDMSFPRAAAVQLKVAADRQRLEAAEAAHDFGFVDLNRSRLLLRQRRDEANQALREALLVRKRRHLLEWPESAGQTQPKAAGTGQ